MKRARTFLTCLAMGAGLGALALTTVHSAHAQPTVALPYQVQPAPPQQHGGTFLKVDGPPIAGDSTDVTHKGWIDVLSFSWGMSPGATGALATGMAARGVAGAARPSSLEIRKWFDKASPALRNAAVTGARMKTVVLEVIHPTKHELYQITMSEVLVSNVSMSSGGDRPTESLTFTYGKLEVRYQPAKADGSLDTLRPVPAGWDLVTNTKI